MQHTEAGNDINGLGAAQHLLDQVIAARAAELARRGAYEEAEALLGGLLDSEQAAPQTLDLGARIAAQTGRYARARELWQRASALAPGEPAYQAALERLALAEHPPRQPRHWLAWCGAAACVVLVLVIVWTAGRGQAAGEAYAPTSMPTLVASATVAPTPLPTAAASPTAAALVVELTPAEIAQSRLEQEPLLLGGQVYAASRQGVLLLYGQVPN
ncbi:MAG: hypothetical protein LLG44_12275, partial [Chloroflexi bacterium]|nr:hypothetical protein [Chloroflexota bacterium]